MENIKASALPDRPLLDLDTLIVRPAITIDGARFELFSADELSVLTSHRLGIRGRRIEELAQSSDPADGQELDELITIVARDVLADVPDDVFVKLSGSHRMAIVDVFTGLLLRKKLGVAGAMATAMGDPRIGEMLFPGFNVSSVGRRDGGWLKRLLRWFGRT